MERMEEQMPEFSTGGVRRRNTLRILVAPPHRERVNLRFVMVDIFKKCFNVDAGRMFCVQDFPRRGLYDVTLESEALCLEVFEQFKTDVGKYKDVFDGITMEPLFSFNVKLVSVLMYNPFVAACDVEAFLRRYGTVLQPEVWPENLFGVWNGKRQYVIKLRADPEGVGGVRHLPAVFAIGSDRGFLSYPGLPTYCRKCFEVWAHG